MSEEERLVGAAAERGEEDETDRSLRPRQLDEFVGQEVVREQLAIALSAAKERGELDRGVDARLMTQMILSPVVMRIETGERVDTRTLSTIVSIVVNGWRSPRR